MVRHIGEEKTTVAEQSVTVLAQDDIETTICKEILGKLAEEKKANLRGYSDQLGRGAQLDRPGHELVEHFDQPEHQIHCVLLCMDGVKAAAGIEPLCMGLSRTRSTITNTVMDTEAMVRVQDVQGLVR
jgi:hypothetical protein